MQMNRMSDVGKLISDFVNSWRSTSKDYGLKKCTSYLTISLPQDARAGVQMIWDLCLEIKYNSRQWTVSKSALRQKKAGEPMIWEAKAPMVDRWQLKLNKLPQIRLTPRRQILLSGFRQILSTISRQIPLLPIDPLCPANIHLWPATNMVGWQIFGKVSWNHEIVESGNHEMLITAGVLLC